LAESDLMTSTRPPRAPLPDWSEGLREGTESLSIRPDDGASRPDLSAPDLSPLAMGTAEEDTSAEIALPPQRRAELAALGERSAAADLEDRTKVDVRLMRPRPPRPGAKPQSDDGLSLLGSTLGSYRLLARIGKGGMGHVYRAEHVRLGREVALKLLRQDYAARKDAVARFFQEARTVNRVRHRNIVDVTDFVELEDGTTFIIMELLTGQSLGTWVRSGIEVPRALAVIAQICEGLAAAHSVNVIHRDLKPDNVIITREPDGSELVKLLDFGVAKLINQGDDGDFGVETAAGSVVGTPAYMSPEQAGGLPIDGRSDIYSLGAIMYELFCGHTMFRGRSFGEYVRKHLTEQPVPPRATPRGARLDPRIEAIILRAIEKEPSRRYQSVTELRDALLLLLGELQELNQSGQRRIPPLPGQSARLPILNPASLSASHPSLRPPGVITGPAAALLPIGPADPPPEHAPLVDITMESEEISRSGSALRRPELLSGRRPAPQPRATPWYVWFVGGALAVGLGIGGATWYAGTLQPAPAALPSSAAPGLVEIRVTSVPDGAGVFKEGGETELCRTPCALNLDPAEQGGLAVRPFVLRRQGYADTALVVDLAAAPRAFRVEMAALPPPPEPTPVAAPEPTPVADLPAAPVVGEASAEEPAPPTSADERRRPARPRTKPAKGAGAAGADDSDFELPARAEVDQPDEPVTPPAPPTPPAPDKPQPVPGKTGKIDRSETIDPFRARP
jgi:serine/threonine protein kinase